MNEINISQINANRAKCEDIFTAQVISKILSYKETVTDKYDGSFVDIEKSILDGRGGVFQRPVFIR